MKENETKRNKILAHVFLKALVTSRIRHEKMQNMSASTALVSQICTIIYDDHYKCKCVALTFIHKRFQATTRQCGIQMSFLQSKSGQGEAHVQFPSYNVSSACMSLCANTACSTYVMLAFVLHGNMDSSRQLTACSRPIADATWWHHTHACTSRLLAQTCRHLCK